MLFINLSALILVLALIIWSCKYIAILVENEKKEEISTKWKQG
jgi:uncharacterized protein involved in response to NO